MLNWKDANVVETERADSLGFQTQTGAPVIHPCGFCRLSPPLPKLPHPSLAVSGCFSSGSPRATAPRPCAGCIACDSCGTLLTAQAENPDYLFFNLNFIICNRFSEKGTHRRGRRGTVAPLLSADLWSSDDTVHTREGVCVCLCAWLCLGGRAECACACVRVCAVFSRHPPPKPRHPAVRCEAQTGALLTPKRLSLSLLDAALALLAGR